MHRSFRTRRGIIKAWARSWTVLHAILRIGTFFAPGILRFSAFGVLGIVTPPAPRETNTVVADQRVFRAECAVPIWQLARAACRARAHIWWIAVRCPIAACVALCALFARRDLTARGAAALSLPSCGCCFGSGRNQHANNSACGRPANICIKPAGCKEPVTSL